jgi:hypothetical protein
MLARHALSASCSSCFSPRDRTHNRHPSNSKLGGLPSQARKLSCPRWELDHISCVIQPIACHYADYNVLVLSVGNVLTRYDEYFVPKTNYTLRTALSHTSSSRWRVWFMYFTGIHTVEGHVEYGSFTLTSVISAVPHCVMSLTRCNALQVGFKINVIHCHRKLLSIVLTVLYRLMTRLLWDILA